MKKITLMTSLAVTSFLINGCQYQTGNEPYKSYGERVEDVKTVDRIKALFLRDPLVKNHEIHVAIDRNVVQLSGFVKTLEESNRAVIIAAQQPNVKEVINNIIVRSSLVYKAERAYAEQFAPSK